ncbi:MAG TPA: secretin N-terminal domain-containing protein [Candidatus Omnitrophota bacterium]|nr:secretin N-terminal domain-containing protein [Candidatus Omnitrophota bacterium]
MKKLFPSGIMILFYFLFFSSRVSFVFSQETLPSQIPHEESIVAPEALSPESVEVLPEQEAVMEDPVSSDALEEKNIIQDFSVAAAAEKRLVEEAVINEQRISLDLKGVELTELFRILSLKMGLTIFPSKSVSGRVNIFLNDLTFDDALSVILVSQDLAAERKGSIINIMTATEYERLYGRKYNEKRIFKTFRLVYAKTATVFNAINQVKSDIGKVTADEATGTILVVDVPEKIEAIESTIREIDQPLETEIFDLQYAKADEIKAQLASAITSGSGELYVDERSSKVIISDLPDKMKKIRRMMKALDEPNRQVFIEGEIVQIEVNNEFQRQINWDRIFRSMNDLQYTGTFPVSPSFEPSPDLSAASSKITVGTLATDKYTTTMKFLETLGQAKILSHPRIAVLNNQEAKILVGTKEAYITSTQSQAETTTITSESVQFIDVGIKLSLTPTINKDGFITMKIKPEVSSVRDTITTETGSRVPIVSTSEAETVVKVKDGNMVMIAGLMENIERQDTSGIPVLSKIPLLGMAFGSKANQKKRTELIVFVTPHIFTGEDKASTEKIKKTVPANMLWEQAEKVIIEEKLEELEKKTGSVLLKDKTDNLQEIPPPIPYDAVDKDDVLFKIKGFKKY